MMTVRVLWMVRVFGHDKFWVLDGVYHNDVLQAMKWRQMAQDILKIGFPFLISMLIWMD